MITFEEFEANVRSLQKRIAAACRDAERSENEVSLLPVTKNHPLDAVEFAAQAGLSAVGENRVQEAGYKRDSYTGEMRWELIGHLQSNKAKQAVAIFDRVQSVDSLKILRRLDRYAGEAGKTLPILLQCNTGEDPNKYGFDVESMNEAVELALEAEALQLDGLMTIAPLDDDPVVAKAAFEKLRDLRDELSARFGCALKELSMGMTGDLEQAIAAGSTQIRVGTALYGARENVQA
ncbi:YggS family pyridoxal phosphate-dependent enzyme [Coraliomargarita sinensis]|uniref:Pyridoxal phosphate homeostasis protein n=1 Tax=Coraliomargarita sinensis TaxID=2174842 RepID=A0A317ZEE0_9BACT|nr:YggS family pyridoxal phosphate-dependent enzyme [Coraliomargarita sinensis]PXA03580.1 YggS family pyridoxal phosphate-dependent enzyme [Coraliomargarita sinensis]